MEKLKCSENVVLTSPRKAIEFFGNLSDGALHKMMSLVKADPQNQEGMIVITLTSKGKVKNSYLISLGTATATLVSPPEVYRQAILDGCTSILLCYNHPSGDSMPSREDEALTDRMRKAGEILGIILADHIIIGEDKAYSFRAAQGWDNSTRLG